MLKLYGDIEYADSLIFAHRWLKGLSNSHYHALLRPLLSTSPIIFFGFEENDPDYEHLKSIVHEHPPSGHASITIPGVVEGQHQDPKHINLNESGSGTWANMSKAMSTCLDQTWYSRQVWHLAIVDWQKRQSSYRLVT